MRILNAKYGNGENSLASGVLIETDALGWVATSEADAPHSGGAWQALLDWIDDGNEVAAYVPPDMTGV
jgi:hypothetical protein